MGTVSPLLCQSSSNPPHDDLSSAERRAQAHSRRRNPSTPTPASRLRVTTILQHHGDKNGCHVVQVSSRERRRNTRHVEWRRRNRCGFVGIRVRRVGSNSMGIGMRLLTSSLWDLTNLEWFSLKTRLWRLQLLCRPTVTNILASS